MITGPLIAEVAGLVGEPARATMLSALLDGSALTATELAYAARITPQTASSHLTKLTEAGLITPLRDGGYRYFRLASPKVAQMLDGIMAVALEHRPRYRPLSRQARELRDAREYIILGDEAAEITPGGSRSRLAGTASGLMGFLQMAMAAVGSFIVALLPQDSAFGPISVFAGFVVLALALGLFAVRRQSSAALPLVH